MNRRSLFLAAAVLVTSCAKPEEPPPPPPVAPADLLVGEASTGELTLETAGEAVLRLTGTVAGAEFFLPDAEALVLRITVNDRITRQLVWPTGEVEQTFGVALGELSSGGHTVKVEVEPAPLSRAQEGALFALTAAALVPHEDAVLARYAPVILGRDDSAYDDTPVLLYGSRTATGLRYSVVFTNADAAAGGDPRLFVARWGRQADLQWALEVDLDASQNATAFRFQGAGGITAPFTGQKEGEHPVLRVIASGNTFSDDGALGLFKFAPEVVPFDESTQPRERVLDAHPWIYALSEQEADREGKLDTDCVDPTKVWSADCYLYVEGQVTRVPEDDTRKLWGIHVLVNGELSYSEVDLGEAGRQDRTGWVRVAVPLPRNPDITAVRLYGNSGASMDPYIVRLANPRAMRLEEGPTELFSKDGVTVTVNQTTTSSTFYP